MKLASYKVRGRESFGAVVGEGVVDLKLRLGAGEDALMDLSLSLPLLKWKDFWARQADAVAAAPFQCAQLVKLNDSFGEMKQSLDRTVPPPLSNFLGLRVTLDRLSVGKDGMPDAAQSAGRLLVATDNPMLMISMAQLGAPPLKDLKLALDGKPVALPGGAMPLPVPAFVAASANALALGLGNGVDAALPAYLTASPGDGKTLLHARVTGDFYGVYGQFLGNLMAKSGGAGEHQELIDLQRQMYERYKDWMAYTDMTVRLGAHGIEFAGTTKFKPAK